MSVQALAWVFEFSEAKGLERAVLQAHANHANGSTPPWQSWTGVDTVTHETRATRRGVQEATRRLQKQKRLVDTGERRGGGQPVYAIVIDTDLDLVDRAARLEREEAERKRSRRGAKRVRPSDLAAAGEESSPPPGEQASPLGGAVDDADAESDCAGAERAAPEPEGTLREPTAANAAAAGEPAGGSSSSSDVQNRDPADEFFSRATDVLLIAGFTAEEITRDRTKIRTELRKHPGKLGGVKWPALGEQLKAGRADGSLVAQSPIGILAFGLRQRVPAGRPPTQTPAAAQNAKVNDRIVIPPAEPEARSAWEELRDGLVATAKWQAEAARRYDGFIEMVLPIRVVGATLEVTAVQSSVSTVRDELMPWLQAYANQVISSDVRWVDRADASSGTVGGA